MTTRGCGLVALALLLVAGLVVPGSAAADPGGPGDGVAAAGGFSDVSGVHAPAVEALAAEGVLDGTDCGSGLFCPDGPLQRSVMAVWLVRILDGAGTAPAASDVFSDVDYAKGYAPFADRLAELAVTRGCAVDPLRYCPDENVTRGQMAAFLVRAFDLEAGPGAGFTDVGSGHAFLADIDALAGSRVTAGCSTAPLRFCPDRDVTRAQMATFLARAAGLIELPDAVGLRPTDSAFTVVSVGAAHACGIRVGGSVECWGANNYGQANAPLGQFNAVSSGIWHSCGIGVDQTVECWGADWLGQASAPDGRFTAVAAGGSHSCGIRADQAVECWGADWLGQASAPDGRFTAVAAGGNYSCGLRAEATVECWGDNNLALGTPPGRFTTISAGSLTSCGVRTDQTVECWGTDSSGEGSPPGGRFASVAAGRDYSCGLRVDDTVECWGAHNRGQAKSPGGAFLAVAAGWNHSCGITAESLAVCWGLNDTGQAWAPYGRFESVSAGYSHSCGLRTDQTIVCWGSRYGVDLKVDVPAGRFTAVSAGNRYSCGVRSDRTVVCWGANDSGQLDTPNGQFKSVSAGDAHSCGIRADGTVECWGDDRVGQSNAPGGKFISVTAGAGYSCGVKLDQTIQCWGLNSFGQTSAPPGLFTSVAAGERHSCGLRTDLNIVCQDSFYGQTFVPDGPFTSVSSGGAHSCGLRADNTVQCWHWTVSLPEGVKWHSDVNVTVEQFLERRSIQAVYAVPQDGKPVDDRERALAFVVSEVQDWFRSQTDGRYPIFEKNGRSISVIQVSLSRSASELHRSGQPDTAEIYEQLGAQPGIPLLILYEGTLDRGGACGWAGRTVVIPIENCSIVPGFGGWPRDATYLVAHELTHLLGAVKSCAPNYLEGHVNDDNRDILYQGPLSRDWDNLQLDVGNDDYYSHGRDDCPDIADHPLLVED